MHPEFKRGMERAAELADLYADENIRMAGDTILADPILDEKNRAKIKNQSQLNEAMVVSELLTLEGHRHSSAYHAGKDIAEMIRTEARAKRI
jgi:hypothetical protein